MLRLGERDALALGYQYALLSSLITKYYKVKRHASFDLLFRAALGSHENLFFDDFWSLVMEYLFLIGDFWSLVMECLFLIGDFWSLVTKHWFLIGDFWSLLTKLVTSVVNAVINTYDAHPIQVTSTSRT